MPVGRKKFEEPSHRPTINPHSEVCPHPAHGPCCLHALAAAAGYPPSPGAVLILGCRRRRPQLIAAKKRPEGLPAYELLYKKAEEMSSKREQMKRELEARQMTVRREAAQPEALGGRGAGSLGGQGRAPCAPCHPRWATCARVQECLFQPIMVSGHKAKEGRAIKQSADLISAGAASKRGSDKVETPSPASPLGAAQPLAARQKPAAHQQQQPGGGGGGAQLELDLELLEDVRGEAEAAQQQQLHSGRADPHIDVLEAQIQSALVRLSLSQEQFGAVLSGAGAQAAAGGRGRSVRAHAPAWALVPGPAR